MSKAAKFLRLTAPEQRLLLRAWSLLLATVVALRLFSPQTLFRFFLVSSPSGGGELPAQRVLWAVTVAGRYVPGAGCLAEALVGQRLLGTEGISSTLRIGVAPKAGALDAHAWLESDGSILIGGDESPARYEIIFASPAQLV